MIEVGTFIICSDKEGMINTMEILAKEGIETEFNYDFGDFRLEVTKV